MELEVSPLSKVLGAEIKGGNYTKTLNNKQKDFRKYRGRKLSN